jgi:hypothetical protein
MFNFNSPQRGTYFDLQKLIIQRMKSAKVNDLIFEAIQKIFEKALNVENIVLSRPEKDRLLRNAMKSILTDMLARLDGENNKPSTGAQ